MKFILALLLLFPAFLVAQPVSKADSIKKLLDKAPDDISLLIEYGDAVKVTAPQELFKVADKIRLLDPDKFEGKNRPKGYMLIAAAYLRQNKWDSVIITLQKGIAGISKNSKLTLHEIILYTALGQAKTFTGDYRTALETLNFSLEKLLALPASPERNKETGKAYIFTGEVYKNLGVYADALKNYQEALTYITDPRIQASCTMSIGDVYQLEKQYAFAAERHSLAMEKFRETGSVPSEQLCLFKLGSDYFFDNKPEKLDSLFKAVSAKGSVDIINKDLYYVMAANVYTNRKDYTRANVYLDSAIQIQEESGLTKDLGISLYKKGKIAESGNDHKGAEKLYLSSVAMFDSIKSLFDWQQSLKSLANLYFKNRDLDNGLKYTALYDSIYLTYINADKVKAITAQEVKYETSLKEAIIANQDIEIGRQKERNRWLIAGSAVALLVILLLSWLYKRIQRQNKQIQAQKQEILHNSRNNIQQLISIFSRQAETEALKENSIANQERLYTLNLLNKLLYEKGEDNQADIKEYLTQLSTAKEIGCVNAVKINVETPHLKLKSNLLKDIGLIVNELTTNAIKYAFPGISNPSIAITVNMADDQQLKLQVKDNGKGLPENFNLNQQRSSFGLEFVNDLVAQHRGTINTYNNNGTCFDISLRIR